ncbi:MAG: hypothetical protein MZV64_72630 [Ignavibacteriales bacterium]|nr:hypothetical protein [Ignavibacteriales bacterium]
MTPRRSDRRRRQLRRGPHLRAGERPRAGSRAAVRGGGQRPQADHPRRLQPRERGRGRSPGARRPERPRPAIGPVSAPARAPLRASRCSRARRIVAAERADALHGVESQHLRVGREVVGLDRLGPHEVRAEVLLVAVAEAPWPRRPVLAEGVLDLQRADDVGARRDARPPGRRCASFCAMMIESPSDASTTGSSSFELHACAGMNSSEMPWMRCCPTL